MNTLTRTISLLTGEPDFKINTGGCQPPIDVVRQQWDSYGEALAADALVARLAVGAPHAVCVGQDVPEKLALEVARLLDQQLPDVGVVLVRQATQRLWRDAARSGIRDIISPAAIDTDLLPALEKAIDRCERLSTSRPAETAPAPPEVSRPPSGRVIVVLSPKGGSGKTMVASNLSAALASSTSGGTVLIDLDCVFGDVASVLGLVPEHTVGHLALMPTLDSTTLKVLLTRHERSGLHVLAGSGVPEEGEAVTDVLAGAAIDILSQQFPYVVVDTAAGLDERALAAIERATDIVFVASMDVTSIRNLAKEVNALDRLGLGRAQRHFILNRADAQVGIEIADVEAALGMKVSAALPSSRLVPLSMNLGETLIFEQPDSPVAQQLLLIAAKFLPNSPGVDESVTRRPRSLFRRRQ
jgi:pilus assembly protein CpaE